MAVFDNVQDSQVPVWVRFRLLSLANPTNWVSAGSIEEIYPSKPNPMWQSWTRVNLLVSSATGRDFFTVGTSGGSCTAIKSALWIVNTEVNCDDWSPVSLKMRPKILYNKDYLESMSNGETKTAKYLQFVGNVKPNFVMYWRE